MDGIHLTKKEVEAVFEWLNDLTGCSPENVFAWDGSDDLSDPSISAAFKVFKACKRRVPENLDGADK